MSATDFDYGGEVAEVVSKFKNPEEGEREARLYGLIRLGTFQEEFKGQKKPAAPQAVAIFHLLGENDKLDDGEPMFFTKTFPLKKGDKSFLHAKFIPAMGGMSRHKGFGTMINELTTVNLVGGKDKNEDGTPKYINFKSMAAITDRMRKMLDADPELAPLENPVGFLREDQLTKEALEFLHPTREFAKILMNTEEFLAGTHPCQELIQSIYDENPERYTAKAKDKSDDDEEESGNHESGNGAGQLPQEPAEQLDEEQEF